MKLNSVAKAVGVATIVLAVAGCDSYSDRPFVMSCRSTIVSDESGGDGIASYTDNFPYNAGGIPLPDPDEMLERVGDKRINSGLPRNRGYFNLGGLTKEEGRLPKTNKTRVSLTDKRLPKAGWEDSGYIYHLERGRLSSKELNAAPVGSMEVEHYYQDGEGDLQPIEFRLAGVNHSKIIGQGVNRPSRLADVAALIPPDAKYAIYKMTFDFSGLENYENTDTFTMWYASPLKESYRYRPNDYEASLENTDGLGRYIFWMKSSSLDHWPGDSPYLPPGEEGVGVDDGYDSAECFARTGNPVSYHEYVDPQTVLSGEEPRVRVKKQHGKTLRGGGMYVGREKSDLENLPDDPDDWTPDNHYLWTGSDPAPRYIDTPL